MRADLAVDELIVVEYIRTIDGRRREHDRARRTRRTSFADERRTVEPPPNIARVCELSCCARSTVRAIASDARRRRTEGLVQKAGAGLSSSALRAS